MNKEQIEKIALENGYKEGYIYWSLCKGKIRHKIMIFDDLTITMYARTDEKYIENSITIYDTGVLENITEEELRTFIKVLLNVTKC